MPCTRLVHGRGYGHVHGRRHGPWTQPSMYSACTRSCTLPSTRPRSGRVHCPYTRRLQPCTGRINLYAIHVHGHFYVFTVRFTARTPPRHGQYSAVFTARTRPCDGRIRAVYTTHDRVDCRVQAVYLAVCTARLHGGVTAVNTIRTRPCTRIIVLKNFTV